MNKAGWVMAILLILVGGCPRALIDESSADEALLCAEDHLEPLPSPLVSDGPFDSYETLLKKSLLPDPTRHAQLLAMTTAWPEWAVYLRVDDKGAWEVVGRVLEQPLWYELSPSGQAEHPSLGYLNVRPREAIPVRASVRRVAPETARVVVDAWRAGLNQVRAPGRAVAQDEYGETFVFADYDAEAGYRNGSTWSPARGTKMADLEKLGYLLLDLAQADNDESAKLLEGELVEESHRVRRRFEAARQRCAAKGG